MRNRLFTLVVAGIVALAIVPSSAWGVCVVNTVSKLTYGAGGGDPAPPTPAQAASQLIPTVSGPLAINLEGRTERVADVLIADDGVAPNCFTVNNSIRLTYNATLTNPTSVSAATTANFDVYDVTGSAGLVILASSTVGLAPGGTPQTVITITVQQGGSAGNQTNAAPASGSAVRVKNLRIDANSLALAAAPHTPATVTVSATTAGTIAAPVTKAVGTANTTVAAQIAAITTVGAGTQSAGGPLTTQAKFSFAEGFIGSWRTAGGTCNSSTVASDTCVSQVANDIATNATSFIFDAGTSVPSNVSVTFPATISESASAAAGAGYIMTLRSGGTCSGSAACFAIYDVSKGDKGLAATSTILTGAAANGTTVAPTACGGAGQIPCAINFPTVGVTVGSPSGTGSATIHVSFGPAEAQGTGNDDVQASAVPRYVQTNDAKTLPTTTRNVVTNQTWFTIAPTRTTLLFPYATEVAGYETGIVVSNTGNDAGVFAAASTANQTGGIKFYFFPTGGTPFVLNTDSTSGGTGAIAGTRGLSATGQLAPGGVFVASLAALLKAAGYAGATYDGYIIAVTGFNLGHGSEIIFNGVGNHSFAPAMVLGKGGRADGLAEGLLQ